MPEVLGKMILFNGLSLTLEVLLIMVNALKFVVALQDSYSCPSLYIHICFAIANALLGISDGVQQTVSYRLV
jgi:hypothetical protein